MDGKREITHLGSLIPDKELRRKACNALTTSKMKLLSPEMKSVNYFGAGGARVLPADPELLFYDNEMKRLKMKELRNKLTKL